MKEKLVLVFLVLFCAGVGIYARFDDYFAWKKQPQNYFFNKNPLFTSYDAYYFARWAKEKARGTYKAGKVDPLKYVPDNYITENMTYPSPIPMQSWLAGEISKVFSVPVEKVALYFTALSVLFVIPVLLHFYSCELPITGLGTALLGSLSLIYLIRTSLMRFDTDNLNLFFPFLIGALLYRSLKDKKPYLFVVLAGISTELYYWWYEHPNLILAIFVVYGILVIYEERKEGLKKLAVYGVLSNPLVLFTGIKGLVYQTYQHLFLASKTAVKTGFPNILISISEAKHFDFGKNAILVAGNKWLLVAGLLGFLALLVLRLKQVFVFLPFFFVGLITFKGGNRFGMYLAPFVGMGLGFIGDLVSKFASEKFKNYAKFVSGAVIAILILLSNKPSFEIKSSPKVSPALAQDFTLLKRITPEDAWIWTWWDYGYAIQYYSERGVFHDGGSQGSPKTYFVAVSFATPSPLIAHNVIRSISTIGNEGIEDLMKSGKSPKEIKDLIISGKVSGNFTHPVFWVFTGDEISKFAWISYFGTWDFDKKRGTHLYILQLGSCARAGKNIVCERGILDTESGILKLREGLTKVSLVAIRTGDGIKFKRIGTGKGLMVEFVPAKGRFLGYLLGRESFKTLFNQMFILRAYDKTYFELVYDDFPEMVVYKVK